MEDKGDANRRHPALIDASSAIILFKSSFFEPAAEYFRIIMAESVYREVIHEGHEGAAEFTLYMVTERFRIQYIDGSAVSPGSQYPSMESLGAGERDAIMLYQKGIGDMIIIDDGKGALYCRKNDIPYINALLVPRILHLSGQIGLEERNRAMEKIVAYGRYSRKIVEYAYGCGDESLAAFL